jgi:hypothetical protein
MKKTIELSMQTLKNLYDQKRTLQITLVLVIVFS